MTRAKQKDKAAIPQEDAFRGFDALMATADVDSQIASLAESGADEETLNRELTRALRLAQDRWGLGLLHLRHEAAVVRAENGTPDVSLRVDGAEVSRVSEGAAALAARYTSMQAPNAEGLSEWGVLPEGHRVTLKGGTGQLRVLVEDARDFETHWAAERGGVWTRTWRQGDTLAVEVHRPASAATALSDAAWDVITSIRDRNFQRELMERSNSVGLLGALLGARRSGAGDALSQLPSAHFTVSSAVVRESGRDARSLDRWKAMLREGTEGLDEMQRAATRRLADVLSHGLR
ncbi:DNA repair protein PprA [Deinococcus aerius]|uniref:DNA repair protein PprA n=1 Tax=Deinococcus aerius TaxID=200253 RepID=A0A2I9D019_9DEIO|nr:DNA repair protein [Deinococcus aerius]GBF07852.1 DNA repair protein PprA [Deinococcus aerius]